MSGHVVAALRAVIVDASIHGKDDLVAACRTGIEAIFAEIKEDGERLGRFLKPPDEGPRRPKIGG